MNQDDLNEGDDYGVPFSEQQYTHRFCYISLFRYKSFDLSDPPRIASNCRQLLSCGTIENPSPHKGASGLGINSTCEKTTQKIAIRTIQQFCRHIDKYHGKIFHKLS